MITTMNSPHATFQMTSQRALLWALLLSAALLLLDLFTYSIFPTPWGDEIWLSEPAINLATQGAFTTSTWPLQPPGAFWAANTPLYSLLLAGWIHLAGQSLLALHALNYVLITLAALIIWWAAGRFRLVTHPAARLLLIPLIHCGYTVSFAYRCSRPDILALVNLLVFVLALACSRREWRGPLAALSAGVAVWTGLQLGPWIGMATILFWWAGWIRVREVAWVIAGGFVGCALLLLFFKTHGVLSDFFVGVTVGRAENLDCSFPSPLTKLKKILSAYILDYSLLPVILASGFFFFKWRSFFDADARKRVTILFLFVIVPPLLLNLMGRFGWYYGYMMYVPACLLMVFCHDRVVRQGKRSAAVPNLVLVLAAAAAIAIGLPKWLILGSYCFDLKAPSEIQRTLRQSIAPADVACCENAMFFQVKSVTPSVYSMSMFLLSDKLPDRERERVNVLVIFPKDAARLTHYFGGEWVPAGPPFGDRRIARPVLPGAFLQKQFDHYLSTSITSREPVQIFRRTTVQKPGEASPQPPEAR